MMLTRLLLATMILLSAAATPPLRAAPPVHFDWFEYSGRDVAFEAPLPAGHYRNPVLAGFHADPSIVAANGKFYLVNSSFTYFPGIPVFESTDLVHWKQIGNVIDRPTQLDFDGLSVSRGIFAPTIEFHDGTFYLVTTATDSGGNFISTARDPAGPWSDPHWLPTIGGIDPSLFFDHDGKVYLLNNDEPPGPARYDGHRAIWMQQIDLTRFEPIGPRKVLMRVVGMWSIFTVATGWAWNLWSLVVSRFFFGMGEAGQGGPIIAILGEYDALPGMSQKVSGEREPVTEGAPGHACGHSGLGTAALGAALAVNLLTFLVYAIDKRAAQNGQWRTKESHLHLLSLAGGWPGAWFAQQSPADLLQLHQQLQHELRENGIDGEPWQNGARTLDGSPWLIDEAQWQQLELGLAQRHRF